MPQGSIHQSRPLTNLSVRYRNEADQFIASRLLPDLPVVKESDDYYVYDNDLRVEETVRANGTPANMATWEVSTSSYSVTEHALSDIITERDMKNADSPLMLERDTTEYLTEKIMLRKEIDAATLLLTTTAIGLNATLNTATAWVDNTTTSAPIQNVLSATTAMIGRAAGPANVIAFSQDVLNALKENAQVYGRIQYVDRAILTKDLLASLFDLEMVLVGSAYYNTAKEGQALTTTAIWGTDAIVAHVKPNPRLKTKTAFASMTMTRGGSPMRVRKWKDESREGNVIEVSTMFDHKIIASSSAYLFKTVTIT